MWAGTRRTSRGSSRSSSRRRSAGARGGGGGGGGGGDTGGYFVKSQWLQEEADAVSRLARKASMDQTEKSVDRYLQAVLDRY